MKPTIVMQLAMPHYRQALVDALRDADVTFYTGDSQAQPGVVLGVTGKNVTYTGPNRFFLHRRFVLQRKVNLRALAAPVVVIELNPRVLNSWIVAIARRILRRRTIAWGHVFPRAGASSRTDLLRSLLRRLVHGAVVYTDSERQEFLLLHPKKQVYVAANAVHSAREMKPALPGKDRRAFILIGRLVAGKKPQLAVEGFARFLLAHDANAKLIVIGSGPEEQILRDSVARLRVEDRVQFAGEITDHRTLFEIFREAVATVASGYVGLNATQSLGFGIPVIYADREPHAPEIEALDESNSTKFEADNAQSLAQAMSSHWDERSGVEIRAEMLSERTRRRYSAEAMAAAFVQVSRDA